MPYKPVIIILNRDCTVTAVPHRAVASKKAQDEVCWRCPQGSAVVQFKGPAGSPFESETFVVPQGGSVCSGPPTKGEPGVVYTYSIVGTIPGDQRQYTADPEVEVDY